jgi:hypothetical protein
VRCDCVHPPGEMHPTILTTALLLPGFPSF